MRFLVAAALALLITACSPSQHADTVFINGNVLTVDNNDSIATALAIKDDKIIVVGELEDISSYIGPSTKQINLNGQTLIPGFIAVHEHPAISSVFAKFVDLSGFTHKSAESLWQALQQAIDSTPDGEWVYGMGLDPILLPELALPTIQQLDKMAPDNPVLLVSQSLHSFWANSAAFEAVEVNKDTPNPGQGSFYEKDSSGELTGFISESAAAAPFLEDVKSPFNVLSNYEQTLTSLVNAGFTSVASLGYNLPPLAAKYAGNYWTNPIIRQFFYMKLDEMSHLPDSPDNGDDFFRILGIKLWHDGSPYTGTMQLEAPYLHNHLTTMLGIEQGHKGGSRMSKNDFVAAVKKYDAEGWQLAIHSQGDASNQEVIEVLKQTITQPSLLRHRLEHGLLLPKEQLEILSELGVSPSFHINHVLYYGDALSQNIIGHDRAQQILPLKSASDAELYPTLHADSPMFPADPFSLMQTAMLRQSETGKTYNRHEAITAQQALRMMTINGAWQLHMDNKLGSLETGKQADLVVLSDNPYELPAQQWQSIKVQQVWLDGQRKH